MPKFKVTAKVITYSYLEVEADTKEEAFLLATDSERDSDDFIPSEEGYFEVLSEDFITEVK